MSSIDDDNRPRLDIGFVRPLKVARDRSGAVYHQADPMNTSRASIGITSTKAVVDTADKAESVLKDAIKRNMALNNGAMAPMTLEFTILSNEDRAGGFRRTGLLGDQGASTTQCGETDAEETEAPTGNNKPPAANTSNKNTGQTADEEKTQDEGKGKEMRSYEECFRLKESQMTKEELEMVKKVHEEEMDFEYFDRTRGPGGEVIDVDDIV
ncbi:hypothetical protein SCAR479_03014 [Seiridium cardinale]|uniref:Uncharacterized protein n=1 Tax=Seiridium cardinale TaxID=138064 RepID=A0ABR2Y2S6_9PEZI